MKIAAHKTLKYDYNFFVDRVQRLKARRRPQLGAPIDQSTAALTCTDLH
jgi:hypothetical protein